MVQHDPLYNHQDAACTVMDSHHMSLHNSNICLQAMADQGSGGAFEISQRMTAMIGWGATTGFAEKWVFDQAADTYALDQEMADNLRK